MSTFLVDAALKGTALLLTLLALAFLFRRAPAAARHLLWSVGLGALLVLPIASQTLPWRLSVLPSRTVELVGDESMQAAPGPEITTAGTRGAAGEPETGAGTPLEQRVAAAPAPASPDLSFAPAGTGATWSPIPFGSVLLALWIAGAALLLLRLAVGTVAIRRIADRSSDLGPAWRAALTRAARRLRLDQPVRIVGHERAPMPFTAGLLRPVIVLPAAARAWSDDRREAVLLHELAHVKRGDMVPHLIAQAACALYWFHPLAWIAARRLRAESERACDDLVLTAGTTASAYAEHLIEIVQSARRTSAPAPALPMAQRSEFEGRLLAILEPGVRRHGVSLAAALWIPLLVALPVLPLAALGPAPAAGPETAATPLVEQHPEFADAPRLTLDRTPRRGSSPGTATPDVDADLAEIEGAVATDPLPEATAQSQSQPTGAVVALVATLADPSPGVRLAAAEALGSLQDTAAVRALMRALRTDDDAEVRRAAAHALGEIEDPTAIPALGEALARDPDPEVRLMATWALGEIEDPRAIQPLGAALRDRDYRIRLAAIHALGEIEDPRAIDVVAPALHDTSAEIRQRAAWALGEIEDRRAVQPLAQALRRDANATVRRTAAWALGEIEDPSAVDALGEALDDQELEVRRAVIQALGEIEDARAVPALARALRDDDVEIRRRAAWALGEIESRDAVEPLTAAAQDADAGVRERVVWALGEIEDPRAAAALAAALSDASLNVRRRAAWALGEITLTSAPEALIRALQDQDLQVRRAAAHALGDIEDPAAVPGLAALLRDPASDTETRRVAVGALADIEAPASYEVLVAALRDEDPEIRALAARALGKR